ncbi:MAG TPA: acetylxylan esterase [Terriglobia bacterium]|nr:acetylxylan esterase [Terriglobia bacterium]
MPTRRKFIQTNILGAAMALTGRDAFGADAPTAAQDAPPGVEGRRDFWNDLPRYVTAQIHEARARRLAELRQMRTVADVRARIDKVRAKVWKLIGGQFEKTPLKPKVIGTIDRADYRIEKVIFESRPEVFVTANFYIPKRHKPPYPGIIVPLGHSNNGKSFYYYQYVCQSLARKGYAVLPFDPFGQGERLQYLDPRTGKSLYDPTGEHDQAGRPMLLFGSQFGQSRTWDGIRAVDYLLSRPEVDPERIGCTGQSGGGTMTMWMAALEPRIKAYAASDGQNENVAGPNYLPPGAVDDSEQNIAGSLPEGIDRGDLFLACAPRPMLIMYSRTDSGLTYSPTYVEGTREIYEEALAGYKLLGAADKVKLFGSPLPHAFDFFNRRETYAWFNRWLAKAEWGTEDAPYDESPPGALRCTSTGQVLTSLGGRSIIDLNTERMRQVAPANPPARTPDEAKAMRARAQETLRKLLGLPAERAPLNPRIISSNRWINDIAVDEFEFYSEPQVRVTGWFFAPPKGGPEFPAVVIVSEGGKNHLLYETSGVRQLVREGFAVCAIDLRGLGVSTAHDPPAGPQFYRDVPLQERYAWTCFSLGKPLLGQRVWDFLRCLDYLETRRDVDPHRILGLGEAGASLAVLLSAVLDDRLRSVLLDRPVATYASIVEEKAYSLDLTWFLFDVLSHFDLPDLTALLAPRPCRLLNATNAQGETLAESEVSSLYRDAAATFNYLGAGGQLRLMVRPEHEREKVFQEWLATA